MKKNKRLRVVDLFAGVGGFRVALEWDCNKELKNEAYKFVWGNQWEPGKKVQYASDIYKREFKVKDSEFSNKDINLVKTEEIPNHNLLVAGFPCQDYSVATTKKLSGGIEGKKGVLWWQIERILREKKDKRPDYLLLENVDRLLNSPASQRGRDFAIILTCLNQLGYMVEWRVIDASLYGFPQRRKRVFLLGFKKGTKPFQIFNNPLSWLFTEGIFAKGFPVIQNKLDNQKPVLKLKKGRGFKDYLEIIQGISRSFNKNGNRSPFLNSGVMIKSEVFTVRLVPNYNGPKMVLKDVLMDDSCFQILYVRVVEI